jgi:hypothetical protein
MDQPSDVSDARSSQPRSNSMATFIPAIRRFAAQADDVWRQFFHPYRRDLYYMRGPGPKWHAKHDAKPNAVSSKGPLIRALDFIARLYETMVEARAVRVRLEAERLNRRYHIASKNHDDLTIVR